RGHRRLDPFVAGARRRRLRPGHRRARRLAVDERQPGRRAVARLAGHWRRAYPGDAARLRPLPRAARIRPRRHRRQLALDLQRRRHDRLVFLLGTRAARAGRADPGQRRLGLGRAQPRAADGGRRGAPLRDRSGVAQEVLAARRQARPIPQSRMRCGLAHPTRLQLAEPEPGVDMVARAMTRPRALALALLCTFAGACLADQGEAPVARALASGAAKAAGPLSFVNEAAQRVDTIPDSQYRFDALFVDFNSDGCPDAFVVSHSDWGATSRLWNNRCDGSGTFQHVPSSQTSHYIAGSPLISGWVTRLDFNGDGKQDFWGRHGNAMGARYRNGSSNGAHIPRFAAQENGCEGYCAFGDITGSGNLEVVTDTRQVLSMSGQQLRPASGGAAQQVVGDVTGDGWPDIVQPARGGYWRNDRGTLAWVAVSAFAG